MFVLLWRNPFGIFDEMRRYKIGGGLGSAKWFGKGKKQGINAKKSDFQALSGQISAFKPVNKRNGTVSPFFLSALFLFLLHDQGQIPL
jgi:hypothetical protein